MSDVNWTEQLANQLVWHWEHHLRPMLDGLTDEEYFWEPAEGAWSVRPRGTATAQIQAGAGAMTVDFAFPEPAPVTTIAWRLAHVIVGILGTRNHSHFGGPPCSYDDWEYAASSADALAQLDQAYATWVAGIRALTPETLARPVGAAEGPFAESPMAELVLHIHREVIHHGAEILLLRDLHRARTTNG